MKIITILTFLSLSLSTFAMSQEKLSMKDFKALASKARHREILSKAMKVVPAERTDEWEKIVTTSVREVVSQLETDADREWAFEIGSYLTREHPHLKKDRDLMGKLGDLAVRTFSTKGIAAPYYAVSLTKGDKKCADEYLQEAVTDAFVRPAFENEKEAAKAIAFDLCAKEVNKDWARQMVESEYGQKSACAGLLKLNMLSGVKKAKCETTVKGK